MAKPSDNEYKLYRKIKELEDKLKILEVENARLKKQAERAEPKEEKQKKTKVVTSACPLCGAEIKETQLPHATLKLCGAACGWRLVK